MRSTGRRRVGVVLGAGGPLGGAWTTGALTAVQDRLDVPVGEVDLIAGTSAGSILATALRCGIGVADLVAHERGTRIIGLSAPVEPRTGRRAGIPPVPLPGVGSPRLLLAAALDPLRMPASVVASGWLPTGRGRLDKLEAIVEDMVARERPAGRPDRETWVVALDYDRGERVAFGRAGAPPAGTAEAVAASCAVPGWFRPVEIGGVRYVDGGTWSSTSVDLLAGAGLDEVYVLAPMASEVPDAPRSPAARLERRYRRHVTAGLRREVAVLSATGTTVHVLTPGPEDLAVIGANMMDPTRRRDVLATSLRTSAASA